MDTMPEWYKEITNELKNGKKEVSPEKQIIIDYLRQKLKELESS